MKKKKLFALIPARKGSKGIKDKNIIRLNKKYLIEHTFDQAKKSKKIDKIFVSSNDDRILKLTRKFKKIRFIKRKNYLSNSKALLSEVIIDFLNYIEKRYDLKDVNIIILQPTSPLRTAQHIDKAVEQFNKRSKFPLISVSEPISNPNDIIFFDKKKIIPFNKSFVNKNRQDFTKCFYINGCIYISSAEYFKKNTTFFTKNSTIFKMDKKYSIEIDDYFDLQLIKTLI